ncbi:hypothetical protein N8I77_004719 [Diaporthe amygdali]|uniref:BTB domain-containing protein n=1 Tax=Phomopsis amygdali TaxID=1214568 RepID=A0AAD9W840_PHOAM|nr:hypothetical protein N8I77_004719 [Diaporthe amygdali]
MSQSLSTRTQMGRWKPASGKRSQNQEIIHLRVGETVFITTRYTLCKESSYLQSLLSDRKQQLTDGTYFVDADPKLFAYILRYLRHGIYPVLLSGRGGHDLTTYVTIERFAADLQIEGLAKWLHDKHYESAIECSVSFDAVMNPNYVGPTILSRPYLPTDDVDFLVASTSSNNGRVWEVKKRFTVRPEAILRDHA